MLGVFTLYIIIAVTHYRIIPVVFIIKLLDHIKKELKYHNKIQKKLLFQRIFIDIKASADQRTSNLLHSCKKENQRSGVKIVCNNWDSLDKCDFIPGLKLKETRALHLKQS